MKYLIFVLLLAVGCREEEKSFNCYGMIILSDANSVQFWVNGQPTFNEKIEDGVEHICFFQPFNADDEIKMQFQNTTGILHNLLVYNIDNELIQTIPFEEVVEGVYQLTFKPEDYAIETTYIKFKIQEAETFVNGDFEIGVGALPSAPDENGWYEVADGGSSSWDYDEYLGDKGVRAAINTSSILLTKTVIALRHEFNQIAPLARTINYKFRSGARSTTFGTWTGGNVKAVYFKDGVELSTQVISAVLNANTTYEGSFVTTETDFDVIAIRVAWTSTNSGGLFLGSNEFFALLFEPDTLVEEVLANSDFLDIKVNHKFTRLIQVSNEEDYANLIYEEIDPTPSFGIRVKCKFQKQRGPEENESEPLSSGEIVKLLSTTKKQKLIQVEPAPFYFHTKIQLYLQHNTCYINNEKWLKEENYELKELDEQYPFHAGECYLTQQDDSYTVNPFA